MVSLSDQPLVIDSFLAVDGRVTDLAAHVERFTTSVRALLGDACAAQIPDVVADLRAGVGGGRRFPRLEGDEAGVRWVDRPAPSTGIAQHIVAAVDDERMHPTHKGPDLPWLQSVARGGDVLLTRDGHVVESTTTALIIVNDAAHPTRAIAPATPGLPSTTLAWFNRRVFPVELADLTVDDVLSASAEGRAIALNALHGPRLLTTWHHGAPSIEMLRLVPQWRERWLADAESIR